MMSQSESVSAVNSLYCGEDASDVVSYNGDTWVSGKPPSPSTSLSSSSSLSFPSFSLEHSPPSDESTIDSLFDYETQHMPVPDYLQLCRDRTIDVTSRQDSINWILKVHAYYHFRPVTALLSINYFDRFLSSHSLSQANGWPFQLLSVACLSLAAKMEEPQVPLLLDLQVFEPRFVFDPKTIQRMELRVMVNLDWRLRSITPFDYLHYFISKLPSSIPEPDFVSRVFSASSGLILCATRVTDFLGFAPSTIAAAAVLCGVGDSFGDGQLEVVFHERVNNEMLISCHQLMEQYLIDTCPAAPRKSRRAEPPAAPPSPIGVLDAAACVSCETRSGSGGRAEPPAKRVRLDVQQP
ncbi:Cyclin_N domain-containing protein/Cyclin_C domain-containing protein [Cephalotus follicularis]|uniref:B-like cyclin n=1 Tax=Cephalotus follicularis TaxID=3775 RepID=A0A1Q3CLK7_CEPFO|nr:Cyclin_N domain-containing protein/Cyclin_C domain-containing protein [Cephalotus follicularis]